MNTIDGDIKNVLKILTLSNEYKQYSYFFKVNVENIEKIGIFNFIFLAKKTNSTEVNIIYNESNIHQLNSFYEKLSNSGIKTNNFILITKKESLENLVLKGGQNLNILLKINYNKSNLLYLRKNILKIDKYYTLYLLLDELKNQDDVNKSYFLEIFNLFKKNFFYINTDYIRCESAYRNIYTIGPKELNFDINEHCNANCIFCYTNGPGNVNNRGGYNENKHKSDIPIEKLQGLIDGIEYIGTEILTIGITGEPFLSNEKINTFLEGVKRTRLKIGFLTNGYLLQGSLREIKNCKNIESFVINISAGDLESFKNTRIGGNFDDFLGVWESIKTIKRERGDIKIKALYVLTPLNYTGVEQFLNLCNKVGVDEIEINKATTYQYNTELNIDSSKLKMVIYTYLKKAYSKTKFLSNIHFLDTETRDGARRIDANPKKKDICLNHYLYLGIYRNNIYSCCKFNFKIGSFSDFNMPKLLKSINKENVIFNLNNKKVLDNEKCHRCVQYNNTLSVLNYLNLRKKYGQYI